MGNLFSPYAYTDKIFPPGSCSVSSRRKPVPSLRNVDLFLGFIFCSASPSPLSPPVPCYLNCFSPRIIVISGSQILPCGSSSFWVSSLFSVLCSFIHILESACQVSPKAQGTFDWNYIEFRKSCYLQVYVPMYLTIFCSQVDHLYSVILH